MHKKDDGTKWYTSKCFASNSHSIINILSILIFDFRGRQFIMKLLRFCIKKNIRETSDIIAPIVYWLYYRRRLNLFFLQYNLKNIHDNLSTYKIKNQDSCKL